MAMVITMTMISTIMRPMMMITTTAKPMSYLTMTRKIVATMTTIMGIIFLATTAAHPNMAQIIPLLSKIIMRNTLLNAMDNPTMEA